MIVFLEANFIQVIALFVLAGTLFSLKYNPKTFFPPGRWLIVLMMAFVCVAFAFNGLIDPLGWLNTGVLKPLSVQDRREKINLYHELPAPPEILVVGSSRSMMLDPVTIEQTCGLPAFNAAVSNAKMEDVLAASRYFSNQHMPQSLIIGLDITLFETGGDFGLQAIHTAFYQHLALPLDQQIRQHWKIVTQYLSMDMTLNSYEVLKMELSDSRPSDLYTFDELGRVVYAPYDAQIVDGTFIPKTQVDPNSRFLPHFSHLDKRRVEALKILLAWAEKNEIKVVLFLPPYFPVYLEVLKQDAVFTARYAETVSLLEKLANRYDFRWYDFTDITAFEGEASEFYDVIHYTLPNANRLLNPILNDLCNDF